MGKTVFNASWTKSYNWVIKSEDRHKAVCRSCNKTIDLGKMGEAALRSHEKSEKHKINQTHVKSSDIRTLFIPPPPANVVQTANNPAALPIASTRSVSEFVARNDILKSEILWTINTIVNHSSYHSNEKISDLFQAMFPDSPMARKFSCGSRKTSYLAVFGIAEAFKKELQTKLRGPYVVLFDESLNKKIQEKQMDIHVRFWDESSGQVETHYHGSQFLGNCYFIILFIIINAIH